MICPHCKKEIASPAGWDSCVNGVEILMVGCPNCQHILGVVHRSHSAYLRRCNTTPAMASAS